MINRQARRAIIATLVSSGLIVPAQAKLFIPAAPAIIKPSKDWAAHEKKLKANFLPGMMPAWHRQPAGGSTPTVIFNGTPPNPTINIGNSTTYTFTNHAISTAAADRLVVVGIGRYRNAGTVNISAVTFGGVAANLVAGSGVGLGSTATGVVWYQLGVAAGTTSTIVVTWTASANNCAIAVYSLYGLISSTVNDVRTDSATAYSLPFTNPAGAILLAMGMSTAVTTVSWAGVTENFDAQSEAAMTYSGGSIANAGASTTVTPTWTSETGLVVSGVAYV